MFLQQSFKATNVPLYICIISVISLGCSIAEKQQ